MIRRLTTFALEQPLFVFLLTGLFIFAGVIAFKNLSIEAFPDVTDIQVTVITLYPGYAAEEVEKQVTTPIEIALSGLPNAVRMFSHTQFGLSFLIVTFNDKSTDAAARQIVLERLRGVELPAKAEAQLAPLTTPIGELFRYQLRGRGHDLTELRSLQDWVVERQMRLAPGVADVVTLGGFLKQYQVNLDLAKLKSYNVPMQQVFNALGQGNANAGGSYLEQGDQQYLIRGIGLLRSPDDIGAIIVSEKAGTPLLIRDLATVTVSAVPRQGTSGRDAEDEIVTGIVLMRKGENPSEVLAAVKERVRDLNETILPKGVKVEPFYDRSTLIDTTLHTVFKNLIEGALLVTIVLYLFLGHFRSAAIVAVIIPLALLGTFIGLQLRNLPANLLSLGAMDFGIIVDGAVIVLENIFRHLAGLKGTRESDTVKRTIIEAAAEVGRPTLFSMLIIIIAHLPIFTLQRQEGRIFAPMAYTIVSALIGSLVFSVTLVPLLAFFLLRGGVPHGENRLVRWSKAIYRPALVQAVRHPVLVLIAAVAALAGTLTLAPGLGSEFLPELNEGSVWVNLSLPAGISVTQAVQECARVRRILREFKEVRSVVSKAGRPEDGADPKQVNMAEFLVDLYPEDQWKRKIAKNDLLNEFQKALEAVPGYQPSFSQPIRDNILESISQIDGQVVIKIFGDDITALQEKAQRVLETVRAVRGVNRAFIDRAGQAPQLQIEIDRGRAARYGLNVADVQNVVETALGGKQATEIWEGERRYPVVVRLREEQRADIASIGRVPIDTPRGTRIPLEDIATLKVRGGSMNIAHESGKRLASIGVFLRGRDMGSAVDEMQRRVRENVRLPNGYFLQWGGEFENQQRAMARLRVIVPLSIFLIFLLLFNAFGSVKSAALILSNIPLALVGGILALLLTHIPLSVSAAIGFIALFGQAVLNGVVIVSYFNTLRAQGMDARQAAVEGSLVRFRTVFMTALLAMLGLLPMALSRGLGSEVQKPLAVVIIGGLVSATFLTLVVLPALYSLMEPGVPAANKV
ncbi:MAG TPA: CusA/CzcA family heavy metal efflux RND transporter [Bryobacteraceae bacterium]|nr:CusA/CzcA family heavy metal efflux RND transporter [Bryobacteraceae bacterium]